MKTNLKKNKKNLMIKNRKKRENQKKLINNKRKKMIMRNQIWMLKLKLKLKKKVKDQAPREIKGRDQYLKILQKKWNKKIQVSPKSQWRRFRNLKNDEFEMIKMNNFIIFYLMFDLSE